MMKNYRCQKKPFALPLRRKTINYHILRNRAMDRKKYKPQRSLHTTQTPVRDDVTLPPNTATYRTRPE